MDGSGSPVCLDGNNDRKRKGSRDDENAYDESRPSKIMKSKQPSDATQMHRNMSGVKSFLHGISYQIKLCIYVYLANAKRTMNPTENGVKFRFSVKAEDPEAGKFDDIVYEFQDGDHTGTLKIQAKHSSKSPTSKITLKNLTTSKDAENQFALLKYFTSFCDQQQSSTDMEGYIISTNWDVDNKAKDVWKIVEPAVMDESTPSLDSYVSSLFDRLGGKCYQLDYNKVWTTDGMFSDFQQLLRQCSKQARLARDLVKAVKSKKKITCNNFLYKHYRPAIIAIIDRDETESETTNDLYRFTNEFLDSSYSNAEPGYETFRKEFENRYRNEFKIQGSVWDDLKLKRVAIAKGFVSGATIDPPVKASFPDDDVDECFKSFCERFRLVCGTYNEQGLEDVIAELLSNLDFGDDYFSNGWQKGCIEENVATEKLFKTNFDWLMDPFAEPFLSEDMQKILENIGNTLRYMKMKGISDKLRRAVVGSSFRIRRDFLEGSDLYEQVKTGNYLDIEARDLQFSVTLLTDILDLLSDAPVCILFLNDSDFIHDSRTVEKMLRFIEYPLHLIVICNDAFKTVQRLVKKWEKDFLRDSLKKVFLIGKSNNISTDLSCYRICGLTADSRKQFLDSTMPLYTTTISVDKIFQSNFHHLSIEDVIKVLEEGQQTEKSNGVVKKYQEIEPTYVQRRWVQQENDLESKNLDCFDRFILSGNLKEIHKPKRENISFIEMMEYISEHPKFDIMEANNSANEHTPIVSDKDKKILILLAEAGFGKSTNLTWLAWHLQKESPSSWIVRCNLSDYCTEFKSFTQNEKNESRKVIDDNIALRILYKLVYISFQLERETVEKCSECLVLSNGKANVNDDLMRHYGLSLNNKIQLLVFKEKFNAGELVLLLDGFDEIAPHYKEVVMMLISMFEQFIGLKKLYLASRPYGFKKQFKRFLKDPSIFQLNHLSLQEKRSLLYKMMKVKWHNGNIDDEATSVLYETLCLLLLYHLDDMSNVPLNLMMSVDILVPLVEQYTNIPSKTISIQLFKEIERIFKPSVVVREFVKIKIRHLLYDKNGTDKNVADKPLETYRFEKAIADAKLLHGLVALWVLFDKSELDDILSDNEIREAKGYMNDIHDANEKTGIINGIEKDVPMFIHRSFAEYLAACCIVQRQLEGKHQGRMKISSLKSFWEQKGLRRQIDTILAKSHHLHLAIIERNWTNVEQILSTNPESLGEGDDGNRTPLHLSTCYSSNEMVNFLPKSIESDIINYKDRLFGLTALDYLFLLRDVYYDEDRRFLYYLLSNGASINAEILYDHVVANPGAEIVRKAAKYVKHVMAYLSHHAIAYESHDACKRIKQFCDKVAHYFINESSINLKQTSNFYIVKKDEQKECNDDKNSSDYGNSSDDNNSSDDENTSKGESIFKDIIKEDAVWMLESIIQQVAAQPQIIQMNWKNIFNFAWKSKSFFVLKYIVQTHKYLLSEDMVWKCIVISVNYNYKNEFKWFVDDFCDRHEVIGFQPCSIHDDNSNYLFDAVIDEDAVDALRENTKWNIPTQNMINPNILCMLTLCAVMDRPAMVRYMKESCQLNLCTGHVYYLAMIAESWLITIYRKKRLKPKANLPKVNYECLLNLAPNISDAEATHMFRLALTSNLFKFAKRLIEGYNINFQAMDEFNGWNDFHLCISDQYALPVVDVAYGDYDSNYDEYLEKTRASLFRYMLKKESVMDCFGVLDKKGRSIIHLAFENGQYKIVEMIVAHKLGLDQIEDIRNLSVHALPNLIFCCREIHKLTKLFEKKGINEMLWMLATQIGKLLLTTNKESSEPNSNHLLLQKDFIDLYQIAVDCRSLTLMYYLYREFHCEIPPSISDAGWLLWIAESLKLPNIRLFKWGVRQYCHSHQIPLPHESEVNDHIVYDDFVEYNANEYREPSVNLKTLVIEAEATLSKYQSKEEVCIMQLVVIAICSKHVSALKYLCETFKLKLVPKVLIDIVKIAHHSIQSNGCDDFDSVYEYLFERMSDLYEIDAEGRNLLHLSAQSGISCLAMVLIKRNMFDVMDTNNGLNVFHYYASKNRWCDSEACSNLFENVLEMESDEYINRYTTETQRTKIKEICFNSVGGRQNVIQVAIEAGNIRMARDMIELGLGFNQEMVYTDPDQVITTSDKYFRFKKCYDMVNQTAAKHPFNAKTENLLDVLAISIDGFSFRVIEDTMDQDYVVEEAYPTAIKYRLVSTLQHLITFYDELMNLPLVECTSRELFACMMECIRQNRNSLFKLLIGHYCILQDIQPSLEDDYEEINERFNDKLTYYEDQIHWTIVERYTGDMNREYFALLILSVAYERLSMTKRLCKMLQLAVDKPLILLIMKGLKEFGAWCYQARVSVYEYLASITEDKTNLLHIGVQAKDEKMLEYLIKDKHLDPNEIDAETGWTAGHYCVSKPATDANTEDTFKVFKVLMHKDNLDCFRVSDRNGRSVLHLALENGHRTVAEYIIYLKMGMNECMEPWMEWRLEKIQHHHIINCSQTKQDLKTCFLYSFIVVLTV